MGDDSESTQPSTLGHALAEFALNGAFPEGDASSMAIRPEELPAAIRVLTKAKATLEGEVHQINEETADDVRSWMSNAKTLQADINRSKSLANDILRQADTPELSGKDIEDAEARADFLVRELSYNQQVQDLLRAIKAVNGMLDRAEVARNERRILDALRLLESAWSQLDSIIVGKSCKAIKLLDIRAFELKSAVHDVLDHVWAVLINVNVEEGTLSIHESLPDEPMALQDAVIGFQAYRELDKKMDQLWHQLDESIISPRTRSMGTTRSAIHIDDGVLTMRGSAADGTKALFADLEIFFQYLAERLPADLVQLMASAMMPHVTTRITTTWLDAAVTPSLESMDEFQDTIAAVEEFSAKLDSLEFSATNELKDWVDNAPRVWLAKYRENALDTVRSKLAEGLGQPREVERVEKQMVSRSEVKAMAANSTAGPAETQDWDAAWSDDEGDKKAAPTKNETHTHGTEETDADGADAWGWGEGDDEPAQEPQPHQQETEKPPAAQTQEDDDDAEAWGWGAEDTRDNSDAPEKPSHGETETRELTLKETYNISSLPDPILALISAILEDGAVLTQDEHSSSPVAAAAAGLFSLPTLALAMFRAISPYYYSLDIGGNMYLYNDATFLAERLGDMAAAWSDRADVGVRAKGMLRVDNDIKTLQSFAARTYSNEMNVQKAVLRDILGGEQNAIQQEEAESSIDAAVARVRSMAVTWQTILARSAWFQAVGSLVDAVSTKIIADVMDMSAIGQDEAYNIARLIAVVTELDDLFLPSRLSSQADKAQHAEEIPTTAQYAASWLRLKYLSEILQSNLRDVKYLWAESELSLYFSAEEVVELVNMSFEDNPRTRDVVREITHNPHPIS